MARFAFISRYGLPEHIYGTTVVSKGEVDRTQVAVHAGLLDHISGRRSQGQGLLGILLLSACGAVFNVKDYGASGKKADDARPAIQQAIDACAAAEEERKLHAARHPTETPLFADCMWRGGGPDLTGNDGARPAGRAR